MKLSYWCTAVTHTSGRVTLTPIALPAYATHASSIEQAKFELTLALDDALARTHPRHLWRFLRTGEATLAQVPITRAEPKTTLTLPALLSDAHAGHTEVQFPLADLQFWFASSGKQLIADASALMTEWQNKSSIESLLRLRTEGTWELIQLEIDIAPPKLESWRRRELTLEMKPPPRGLDDQPADEPEDDWNEKPQKPVDKGPKRVPTPVLDRLGVKWHQLAKDGAFAPTFGREALIAQVLAHVTQRDAEPLVLVGASGVGKTAILHEVARQLVKSAPARAFVMLDGSRLIAGSGGFGEWQEQTLNAFAEAEEAKALLHLGRVIDLLDAGRSAHSDDNVAQLILPMLAAREVAVVGELSVEEWARLQARNQSFARLFVPLIVDEPAATESEAIVRKVASKESAERDVRIAAAAVDEVRSVVRRFKPYGSALGNTIAMLRRLIDGLVRGGAIGRDEVIRHFSIESGVPERLLRDDVPMPASDVRAFLGARVKGQDDAIERLSQVVSVVKANLADPGRPVATLLFAGPTGVGKTELSKALAEFVFGSKDRLVRLDMGEYSSADALVRLIGDAHSDGFLPTIVRRQPFAVVLLDEIEKAHPAVFDALLGVLGEGRLTDGRGRLTDFRSAMIVMTSNLGAQSGAPRAGFGGETGDDVRTRYLSEIRRFFRPEFFNRIDDVIIFGSLGPTQLSEIVERELSKVASRSGFARLDVSVQCAPEVKDALATWGHEPRYGARPLKRVIERRLVVPAAAHLAAHPPSSSSTLEVSLDGESVGFRLEPAKKGHDAAARAALLAVCERAGALRAEVRAWARAPLMSQLRESLRLFERLSKQRSFWLDRDLADQHSRRAALTRQLEESFAEVRAQAEAAEELAIEAWAMRERRSVEELDAAVRAATTAFEPLTERLFASRLPHAESSTVILVPGKGAMAWARWLRTGYRDWATARTLRHETSMLVTMPSDARAKAIQTWRDQSGGISTTKILPVLQTQGVTAAARVFREIQGGTIEDAMRLVSKLKSATELPESGGSVWVNTGDEMEADALALRVYGPALPLLLSGEHGSHRFFVDGNALEVKVLFLAGTPQAPTGEKLEAALSNVNVRRVWPRKKGNERGVVKDLRTETDHAFDHDFEFGPVLAAYVRHIVFSSGAVSWS